MVSEPPPTLSLIREGEGDLIGSFSLANPCFSIIPHPFMGLPVMSKGLTEGE
jgi:hypothetical protein